MAVVTLPVVEESTSAPSAVPRDTEKQSPLAGLHILLVDDSDDAREPLRLLLRSLGTHVEAVRDGRDGLEIARTSPLDLVLCDLRMPMMDGYEFIRQLGRNSSTLAPPVIALSGLASEADRWCTSRAGFEAHLAKPVDERTLVATLNSVLSHPRPRGSNIAP